MQTLSKAFIITVAAVFLIVFLSTRSFREQNRAPLLVNEPGVAKNRPLNISVVYFAYLNPELKWKELIREQLNEVVLSGLVDATSEFHVVLTAPTQRHDLLKDGLELVQSILPRAIVHQHAENQYEYQAIHLVWSLAQRAPFPERHLVLFFCSKGMVNQNQAETRSPSNKKLTDTVITPWRKIIDLFNRTPNLNKAGFAASPKGWVWFNFWWARASYLTRVVEPILTTRRHYYEDWLGRINAHLPPPHQENKDEPGFFFDEPNDTLSLCSGNSRQVIGKYYVPGTMNECG